MAMAATLARYTTNSLPHATEESIEAGSEAKVPSCWAWRSARAPPARARVAQELPVGSASRRKAVCSHRALTWASSWKAMSRRRHMRALGIVAAGRALLAIAAGAVSGRVGQAAKVTLGAGRASGPLAGSGGGEKAGRRRSAKG